MSYVPKFKFVFSILLADSGLSADSGVVGLTVRDAGHDFLYCLFLSLASHCGDLGNCMLWLNASYLFLVKVSLVFFLFSPFLAFCWLFHRRSICFADLR